MTPVIVRMGRGSNNTPVFTIPSYSAEFARPFGATRDKEQGLWLYPAYFPVADIVLEDFNTLGIPLEFSPAAQRYVERLAGIRQLYEAQHLPPGFEFKTAPFAHQVLGLAHVYHMLRAALFYAPGLGKSKVAIDWMRLCSFLGEAGMTVVLGPLVTIRNWGKEIDTHSARTLRWGAVLGTVKQKERVIGEAEYGKYDVLLLTYDTARNFTDHILEKVEYSRIVADESHRIKNWRASRTAAAFELGQKAERKIIMTGTPTLGSPEDLYGQFKFLGHYFMPENPRKYREKFFEVSPANEHLILGYKNLPILNRRTTLVSLRRTKEECLDLPEQMFVDVTYDLGRQASAVYNKLIIDMGIDVDALTRWLRQAADAGGGYRALYDADGNMYTVPQVAVLLNKLSQVRSGFLLTSNTLADVCDDCEYLNFCTRLKIHPYTQDCSVGLYEVPESTLTVFEENAALDTLEELLDTILGDPANKALIWCRYSYPGTEVDMISDLLTRKGIKHTRVGKGEGGKVFDYAEAFNADPEQRVYVAQASTGEGITLNSANYTIFYNFDYALQSYLQPLDRNHRIGQSRKVTVYRMMAENAVDATIVSLLQQKVAIDRFLTVPGAAVPGMVARQTVRAGFIPPSGR